MEVSINVWFAVIYDETFKLEKLCNVTPNALKIRMWRVYNSLYTPVKMSSGLRVYLLISKLEKFIIYINNGEINNHDLLIKYWHSILFGSLLSSDVLTYWHLPTLFCRILQSHQIWRISIGHRPPQMTTTYFCSY